MAISKNLSLPRPLNLPKPAPTAQSSAPKPPKLASGDVAGQAAAPQKPATKPQEQLSRPSVDSFNPNTKPKPQGVPTVGINPNTPNLGIIEGGWVKPERTEKPPTVGINPNTPNLGIIEDGRVKPEQTEKPQGPIVGINPNTPNGGVIIPGGGWANPERTEKPQGPIVGINPNAPNGGIIIPGGGWANPQRAEELEVTGPAIGGRNPHATGDINTHGKPTPPEPWTTYGEALEQNRDVFPNKDAYDLGAAFDQVFGQGVGTQLDPSTGLDVTAGGAELQPGGAWGDLIEANKDSIPPGWANNE